MQQQFPERSRLVEQYVNGVYGNPNLARIRFPNSVICPRCHAEQAHVLQDDETRRLLQCMNCGLSYKEKDMVA